MNTKNSTRKIILLLIIMLLSTSVLAESNDDGFIDTDDANQGTDYSSDKPTTNQWSNAYDNWDKSMLNPFDGFRNFGEFSSDNPLRNLFYPVEQWEIDYCASTISTDYEFDDKDSSSKSSFNSMFWDTSSTLQGLKTPLLEGEILYEFSWYVHPKSAMEVAIYAYSKDQKKWIEIAKQQVPEDTSWAEYVPFYSEEEITKLKISFPQSENDFVTKVVSQIKESV